MESEKLQLTRDMAHGMELAAEIMHDMMKDSDSRALSQKVDGRMTIGICRHDIAVIFAALLMYCMAMIEEVDGDWSGPIKNVLSLADKFLDGLPSDYIERHGILSYDK